MTQKGPGRRRTFEDEQAFQHITQILLESGMSALSLPALGRRLGIRHQSLGNRFESRENMLKLYLAWRSDRYREQLQQAISQNDSTLFRLWRILILPLGSSITGSHPGPPAHWITLNLELYREPSLADLLYAEQREITTALVDVLEQSVREGLLHPCNPAALAEYLYAATIGGAVKWYMLPDASNEHMMERACLNVLQPYLVTPIEPPSSWFE